MKINILLTTFLLIASLQGNAQKKYKSYLLMNGTAHLATGEVINNSLIGFQDGKLNLVMNALLTTVDTKKYDTVIDIKGKHVYPGFIAPNIIIGLGVELVFKDRDRLMSCRFSVPWYFCGLGKV